MGTNATVYIKDGDSLICAIERTCDGYLSGLGMELLEFLKGKKIVNGFSVNDTWDSFNGMGCLAASLVKHLKHGIGDVYMCFPVVDADEYYSYTIYNKKKTIYMTVKYGDEEISGPIADLIKNKVFKDN